MLGSQRARQVVMEARDLPRLLEPARRDAGRVRRLADDRAKVWVADPVEKLEAPRAPAPCLLVVGSDHRDGTAGVPCIHAQLRVVEALGDLGGLRGRVPRLEVE